MESLRLALPADLNAPAETRHFEGSVDPFVLKSGVDLYEFTTPVTWSVDITNTGDALLVTGSAEGVAKTSCARCLDAVEMKLIGEIEGFYLLDGEDAPEDLDDDEHEVLPDDHVIDLSPLITSALLLEVPLVPLCRPDCRGICPQCGKDLNDGPCECPLKDSGGASSDSPFSVLKDFDFGN